MTKILFSILLLGIITAIIAGALLLSNNSSVKYLVLKDQSFLSEEQVKEQWKLITLKTITVEKSGCFGTCPILNVSFHRGGTAVYNGVAHTKYVGNHLGSISLYDYTLLTSYIERTRIIELSESYSAGWTDDSTITLKISTNSNEKVIEDYGRQAPPEFQAFLALFDEIVEHIMWFKSNKNANK